MIVYTLWQEGSDDDLPWIVDAVDEYTVEENDWPSVYAERRRSLHVRELLLEVPEDAVRALFQSPTVKASVATHTRAGLVFHHEEDGGDGLYHVTTGDDAACACGADHRGQRYGELSTDPSFGFKPWEAFCRVAKTVLLMVNDQFKPSMETRFLSKLMQITAELTALKSTYEGSVSLRYASLNDQCDLLEDLLRRPRSFPRAMQADR